MRKRHVDSVSASGYGLCVALRWPLPADLNIAALLDADAAGMRTRVRLRALYGPPLAAPSRFDRCGSARTPRQDRCPSGATKTRRNRLHRQPLPTSSACLLSNHDLARLPARSSWSLVAILRRVGSLASASSVEGRLQQRGLQRRGGPRGPRLADGAEGPAGNDGVGSVITRPNRTGLYCIQQRSSSLNGPPTTIGFGVSGKLGSRNCLAASRGAPALTGRAYMVLREGR